MTDSITIEVYNQRAGDYLDMVTSDDSNPALDVFMAALPAAGLILDLGCGPATTSNTLRAHGFQVDPVDASIEMVKLANQTFDIGARQMSFHELDAKSHYDGVWANFSLLHASADDFPKHLLAIHCALKAHGVLHIGMKLGDGPKRDSIGRFYNHYSEAELTHYLDNAGFDVSHIRRGEDAGLSGDMSPWATMLGKRRHRK